MKKMPFFLVAGLLLLVPVDFARAGTFFAGETLDIAGVATQTSPSVTVDFSVAATLGSLVPSTTDWTLTAFRLAPGVPCGPVDCSTLSWINSVEFDASTNTFFGSASVPFTGNGGDSKLLTFTYVDGNTSTDPFTNTDITNPSNSRSGTFSYTVVATPEPSSGLLLLSGLILALAATGRKVLI